MNNPYHASAATMADSVSSNDTYEPEVFATTGRIGRLRYMAYSLVVGFSLSVAMVVIMAVLAMINKNLIYVGFLLYIPIFAYTFILAKRRFNDMGNSGWFSVLLIIPLVNFFVYLWLIFGRGDDSSNEYGQAPGENSGLVIAGALLMPVMIVGVLAAVAIPAYTQYVERAKAAQTAPVEEPAE